GLRQFLGRWWRGKRRIVMKVQRKAGPGPLRKIDQQIVEITFLHFDGAAVCSPHSGTDVILGGFLAQAAHRIQLLVVTRYIAPYRCHLLLADLVADIRKATFEQEKIDVVRRVLRNDVEGEQGGGGCPEEVPHRMVLPL